jgi:hypothetical protein
LTDLAFWPLPIQNYFWNCESCRVGTPPRKGDQPDARPLPTKDNTNTDKHGQTSYLEWDSNPRSQCSSQRIHSREPLWVSRL